MKFPTVALAATLLLLSSTAGGQDPTKHYLTIHTTHFRVSFTSQLEPLARRVAANAERAYGQLAQTFHPPRGTVDILVTDDVDYSNGSATPYPTNRIVVYATPPIDELGLSFTTDWAQLVVTHELTHIFHLDRSRALWRLGQYVFGRSPFLFPNLYAPSWLIEGLAVHEESRLAGEGRIEAPEHTMIIRSAAAEKEFLSIGQASLALPVFPRGNSAYAYGSLFMDYLARTRGEAAIASFVEQTSALLVPFALEVPAHKALGISLPDAWNEWRGAVEKSVPRSGAKGPGPATDASWRELTTDGLAISGPRWTNDSTLTYTGTGGRDTYSEFAVTLSGDRTRLARRNSSSPTAPLPDGSSVFSQLELTSLYTERSDLFVQRGSRQVRATRNARLITPDTRHDGTIVATQLVNGGSRLVLVRLNDSHQTPDARHQTPVITPITSLTLDTLWSQARWSNAGDRIVAIRWARGGVSQVIIVDTMGAVRHVATSGLFTASAPSWMPGDSGITYTIADSARNDVYIQLFHGASYESNTFKLARADQGLFEPQIRLAPSLDRIELAGVSLRANGYRLGVTDPARARLEFTPVEPRLSFSPDPRLPPLAVDSSPATDYHGWPGFLPRYWVPLFEQGSDANRLGGYADGWDILRRHYLYVEALFPLQDAGIDAAIEYSYRGFKWPILTFDASQNWTMYLPLKQTGTGRLLGRLDRRIVDGSGLATFMRQRVRSAFTFSLGGAYEDRSYVTVPDSFFARIVDSLGRFRRAATPLLTVGSTYARYRSPPFAISPEDGFSLAATARDRFHSGFGATGGATISTVGTLALYKSLDLPGYAHHVLALRGAGGWSDTRANGYFEVGGVSGGTFEVIPGYTIGEGRETFPVRGFPPAASFGVYAFGGNAEYRAPLSISHRSWGLLPAFINRSSLSFFGDYGVAWCPSTAAGRQVCTDPTFEQKLDIASVGAELNVNAGILSWDAPYRFRIGFAVPVLNRIAGRASAISGYLTSGLSF